MSLEWWARFRLRSSNFDGHFAHPTESPNAASRSRGACARSDARTMALERQRAQGKPGARCTRGLACKCIMKCAHEHTGSAEAIRLSLRDGFTVSFALSLVTGLSCHHRHVDRSTRLDTSVGASGPHDFAVRYPRRSSKAHPRDDREPPLSSGETGETY